MRRMQRLIPEIERDTERCLDELARLGPPADLVQAIGIPIPALVLCALFGIPDGKRDAFLAAAGKLVNLGTPPRQYVAAMNGIRTFLRKLVVAKRTEPSRAATC